MCDCGYEISHLANRMAYLEACYSAILQKRFGIQVVQLSLFLDTKFSCLFVQKWLNV